MLVPAEVLEPIEALELDDAPKPEDAQEPEHDLSFIEERRQRRESRFARRLILKVVVVALLGVAAVFAVRAAANKVEEVRAKKGGSGGPSRDSKDPSSTTPSATPEAGVSVPIPASALPDDVFTRLKEMYPVNFTIGRVDYLAIKGVRGTVVDGVLDNIPQPPPEPGEPVQIDGVYRIEFTCRSARATSHERVVIFRKQGGGTDLAYDVKAGTDWVRDAKLLIR